MLVMRFVSNNAEFYLLSVWRRTEIQYLLILAHTHGNLTLTQRCSSQSLIKSLNHQSDASFTAEKPPEHLRLK